MQARDQFLSEPQPVQVIINGHINPIIRTYLSRVGFLLGGMDV